MLEDNSVSDAQDARSEETHLDVSSDQFSGFEDDDLPVADFEDDVFLGFYDDD